jgi:hypothetical protein
MSKLRAKAQASPKSRRAGARIFFLPYLSEGILRTGVITMAGRVKTVIKSATCRLETSSSRIVGREGRRNARSPMHGHQSHARRT